jgi:ribosomal protein L19E
VRYLVNARKRRRLASDLNIGFAKVTSDPEHRGRIVPAYPRTEIRLRRTWQPMTPTERS